MNILVSVIAFVFMSTASTKAYADNSMLQKGACSAQNRGPGDTAPPLTDDQLERIHAIKMKFEDVTGGRMAELGRFHHQIFDELGQVNVDKSQLLELQNKINALEAKDSTDRLQMAIELHDVFHPSKDNRYIGT